MNLSVLLTNNNINIFLEQIVNGHISEFDDAEEEENFDRVNNNLE